MKRRPPPAPTGFPENLLRFDPADWPEAGRPMQRAAAWSEARRQWQDQHPDIELPGERVGDVEFDPYDLDAHLM